MNEALASEGKSHWYAKDGAPVYTVPCTSKEGDRPTKVSDARKLGLYPSVTQILGILDKPGLNIWKAQQLLEAALTLPKSDGESIDDYAVRVMEDSKAQGIKARDRGRELHAAIEGYIGGVFNAQYNAQCQKIEKAFEQHGIPLRSGNPERSFASELGYGGKIDYSHDSGIILDFKTTAKITPKTKPYDEHRMQVSAYGHGIFMPPFRALNVFVGVEDCEVRIFEHEWPDLAEAFEQFKLLLEFYLRKNKLK